MELDSDCCPFWPGIPRGILFRHPKETSATHFIHTDLDSSPLAVLYIILLYSTVEEQMSSSVVLFCPKNIFDRIFGCAVSHMSDPRSIAPYVSRDIAQLKI